MPSVRSSGSCNKLPIVNIEAETECQLRLKSGGAVASHSLGM